MMSIYGDWLMNNDFFVVDLCFCLFWWSLIFVGVVLIILYWLVFLCFDLLIWLELLLLLFWFCFFVDFMIEYRLFWNWIILRGVIVCVGFWGGFGVFWNDSWVFDFFFGVLCDGGEDDSFVGVFWFLLVVDFIVMGDLFFVFDLKSKGCEEVRGLWIICVIECFY